MSLRKRQTSDRNSCERCGPIAAELAQLKAWLARHETEDRVMNATVDSMVDLIAMLPNDWNDLGEQKFYELRLQANSVIALLKEFRALGDEEAVFGAVQSLVEIERSLS